MDEILDYDNNRKRRRDLLDPIIKIFIWIFMVAGFFILFSFAAQSLSVRLGISLYGLSSAGPYSQSGLIISALYLLKLAVSIGLWTERDWAVKLALFDAALGIIICFLMMLLALGFLNSAEGGFMEHLNLRFELIGLIPYFKFMWDIRKEWDVLKR